MKVHNGPVRRPWVLLAGAVVLIAAHATILRYVLAHTTLSTAVISSVLVLVVIKHLGLLASLFAVFRRRSRH
jgi:hypothetical protein